MPSQRTWQDDWKERFLSRPSDHARRAYEGFLDLDMKLGLSREQARDDVFPWFVSTIIEIEKKRCFA